MPTVRLLPMLAWTCGLAVLLVSVGGWTHGRVGVEKTISQLTFPVQASWMLLSGWTLQCLSEGFRDRGVKPWLIPLLLWGAFTVTGTPPLGEACFRYLESRETAYDPAKDPPLDLLVVLGGSTSAGPSRPEVGEGGDRVLLAAQLFLQGNARHLITTGSPLPSETGGMTSPAEQTRAIWLQLGVPAAAIETLPGVNTYTELQALKQHCQRQLSAGSASSASNYRIGLLTSAWHLPRAMRLARAAGLPNLIPVAADHEQRLEAIPVWDYLPSAKNLSRLERCQREFMALLVGR